MLVGTGGDDDTTNQGDRQVARGRRTLTTIGMAVGLVAGTVLVTGAAGWVFGRLAARSGSLLAPMLAHLAINEAGAVAAMVLQRTGPRRTLPR